MKITDEFSNVMSASVANGASTAFTEVMTGISLGQKRGIIIDHIEYQLSLTALQAIDDDGDRVTMAWTVSNSLSSLSIGNNQVIHTCDVSRIDAGTAANALLVVQPFNFELLPPIIVAAPRIFLGSIADGGVGGSVSSRLYYRYVELTPQEYIEIAETFVLIT